MTEKKSTTKKKTWGMALLQAQRDILNVSKDSTNEYQRFDYTSAEHMIGEAKKVLNENGLIVFEKEVATEVEGSGLMLIKTVFVVSHPESGDEREFTRDLPACPGKGRPEDKAALGSGTTSLSYFLRGLLLIPRVDEEVCSRDDTRSNPSTTRQTRSAGAEIAKKMADKAEKPKVKIKPPKPDKPITDSTLKQISDFIVGERNKQSVTAEQNKIVAALKNSLFDAAKVQIEGDPNNVYIADVRDQISENTATVWLADEKSPF